MLKNGIYNFFGTGFRIALGLITVPVLVYFLKLQQYGIYAILMSIISFAVLTEWSISLSLTIFLSEKIAKNEENLNYEINNILAICLLLILSFAVLATIILWFIAPIIPSILNGLRPEDIKVIDIGCKLSIVIVWARLSQQFFIGIEQAYNKYATINMINTAYNLAQTISIILSAWLTKQIPPIIATQAITSSLFVIVHIVVCKKLGIFKRISLLSYCDLRRSKHIVNYTLRTWFGTIGSVLFNQGDRLIIGGILTVDVVGVYSAITSLAYQINVLSSIPAQPIISIVSRIDIPTTNEENLRDRTLLVSSVQKGVLLNTIVSVSMGSIIVLFAPEIVGLLFTTLSVKVDQLSWCLTLIVLIYTIYSFNAVGYYILFATKNEMVNTVTTLLCGIVTLCLVYFLTNKYGIVGAILGNSAYILTLYLLYRGIEILSIPWLYVYKLMRLPIMIFILSLFVAFFINSFSVRCLFAVSLSSVLVQFSMNSIKSFSK